MTIAKSTTPQRVTDSVEKADRIAKGQWPPPPVWRYPPLPSQVDAVWDALGPARDHIQQTTGKPMRRAKEDTPGSLVATANKEIYDIDLPVNPEVVRPQNEVVNGRPISRTANGSIKA